MKITLELLEQNKACADQRRLFDETFPKGANVNARNLSKARKAGLDVLWLGRLLPEGRKAEYDKVRGAARAEYNKVCGAAWAEYEKDTAAAWAKYNKARDAAWAEYEKDTAAALIRAFEGL